MARRIKQPVLVFLLFTLSLFCRQEALAYSRIISLKPNVTEILFALGAGPKLVGATTYCNQPEAAKKIPRVADYIRVDPEKALALKPDLIVGSEENSSQKEVYFLRDRGILVKLYAFSTIEETLKSIEEIGALLGEEKKAAEITAQMKSELDALKRDAQGRKWKKALYVVGHQPLMVAGSGNFFDEATPYIGAFNVAHNSKLKYPNFSTEQLVRSAPEIIFDISEVHENSAADAAGRREWWKKFRSIPAVQWQQIYSFDIEKLRASPALPTAFKELFDLIHNAKIPPPDGT
jgi:ABC-type Fe3+-hydroxamate transport system substrate-binding protein